MNIGDILGLAGMLRYGVPTAEKERIAISGLLPGAPEDRTAEQDAANRYSAGFLFGLRHPKLATAVQPLVNTLKVSDLPFFGGSSPELQSQASAGVQQGATLGEQGLTLADILGGQ